MLTDLWARRALIKAFADRDFSTRFRTSALGWGWSLVQPLATLAVFAAVFSLVFRVQPPPLPDGRPGNYAAFLFTGLVMWNLFSSILNLSMSHLRSAGDLLRKVQFPAWAPVIGANLVQLIQVALELAVLLLLLGWIGSIGWTWLYAIPLIAGLALFSQGIGLLLAGLNARFGDVQYIVTVVLGVLYFLTPVLYPASLIEGSSNALTVIVEANPLTWFVEAMHASMYSLEPVEPWIPWSLLGLGVAVFVVCLAIFDRTSEDLGEIL